MHLAWSTGGILPHFPLREHRPRSQYVRRRTELAVIVRKRRGIICELDANLNPWRVVAPSTAAKCRRRGVGRGGADEGDEGGDDDCVLRYWKRPAHTRDDPAESAGGSEGENQTAIPCVRPVVVLLEGGRRAGEKA